MSWNYSGFVGEKVEAGRRLLASDPAWAGSEDLQALVEDKDLTDALWRIFLLPSGERRQGLSLHDKRQGLVLFLLSARRKLEMRVHEVFGSRERKPLVESLLGAAQELAELNSRQSGVTSTQRLGRTSLTALGLLCIQPGEPRFQQMAADLCCKEWDMNEFAQAALLEIDLRAAGQDPLLTATDQERLCLVLQLYAARMLQGVSPQPQCASAVQEAAQRATRRLMQLDPNSATMKQLHGLALSLAGQRQQAAVAYRAALQAAEANNSHELAAYTGYSIALLAMRGAEGPTWSLAEVHGLVELAERSLKLCKPWQWCETQLTADIKGIKREVAAAAAAANPGARRLPQTGSLEGLKVAPGKQAATCAACGQGSSKLRRCAACESRWYCCRECQVADWKRGHKAECGRLAAQRGGAS